MPDPQKNASVNSTASGGQPSSSETQASQTQASAADTRAAPASMEAMAQALSNDPTLAEIAVTANEQAAPPAAQDQRFDGLEQRVAQLEENQREHHSFLETLKSHFGGKIGG